MTVRSPCPGLASSTSLQLLLLQPLWGGAGLSEPSLLGLQHGGPRSVGTGTGCRAQACVSERSLHTQLSTWQPRVRGGCRGDGGD